MARMSGMMETSVQNQGQPLRLIDEEQPDVLRARFQAEREKAVADLATGGSNTADREDDSADGSDSETRNPRSQRNVPARKSAAHTRGMQPPVVQPEARDLPLMQRRIRAILDLSLTDWVHSLGSTSKLGMLPHNTGNASEVCDPR